MDNQEKYVRDLFDKMWKRATSEWKDMPAHGREFLYAITRAVWARKLLEEVEAKGEVEATSDENLQSMFKAVFPKAGISKIQLMRTWIDGCNPPLCSVMMNGTNS